MNHPHDSTLGRSVEYPAQYDPGLLFPIPRAHGRRGLISADGRKSTGEEFMPFIGHDRWHAYEVSWLNAKGKPQVTTLTLTVPAYSPFLIESKSLKLYLNSFNSARLDNIGTLLDRIDNDLSAVAGADVEVQVGLPEFAGTQERWWDGRKDPVFDLDTLDVEISHYGPPDSSLLKADAGTVVQEVLTSQLLKSNCPVTSQPDWASLRIAYTGPKIDRESLLRYIVSFRDHCEFHEQCVERIYCDLMRLGLKTLSVDARYTRRGGLDINPWRATPAHPIPRAYRDERQ
jgi:7-cyano-7-deazaguanine reductase